MLLRRERAMVAVSIMLDVAFHGSRHATVNAAEIAQRLGLARRGMEPVLQALSRAGLLDSVRGPRGGYRLGRPARDISLADITAALASEGNDGTDGPRGRLHEAVFGRLWSELEGKLQGHMAALSVDDLLKRASAAGLRRPVPEPLSFAI
jgi:Rrf2 family protein